MKRRRQTHSLPPAFRRAELAAESIDAERRTVELVFYSGAAVFRAPLFDDPFELEFEVSPQAADLSRLNDGAPVIDSHGQHRGLEAMLGVVEKAWLANGEARARVRFSKREEVEPVWRDVLDGVVRNVSMGTYILELEEVTEDGADVKRFRATRGCGDRDQQRREEQGGQGPFDGLHHRPSLANAHDRQAAGGAPRSSFRARFNDSTSPRMRASISRRTSA